MLGAGSACQTTCCFDYDLPAECLETISWAMFVESQLKHVLQANSVATPDHDPTKDMIYFVNHDKFCIYIYVYVCMRSMHYIHFFGAYEHTHTYTHYVYLYAQYSTHTHIYLHNMHGYVLHTYMYIAMQHYVCVYI